jgi:hypothetical protein
MKARALAVLAVGAAVTGGCRSTASAPQRAAPSRDAWGQSALERIERKRTVRLAAEDPSAHTTEDLYAALVSCAYFRDCNSERRERLLHAYAERRQWPAVWVDEILRGGIPLGAPPDLVRVAWGDPADINATTTAAGTHEQWVFGIAGDWRYVYLDGGAVTAVQKHPMWNSWR